VLDVALFAAGIVAVVVAVLWRHLQRWSITPPLLGLLTGVLIGPHVLGALVIPSVDRVRVMQIAARLLLAVALMAIALRYPLDDVRRRVRDVSLLILVVLPVMAGILAVGGATVLGLPLGLALVLGAALCPTDPVLASGIVTGAPAERDIPERDRQELSLESGANDGLALPFVILAVAVAMGHPLPAEIGKALYEVVAGVVVGAVAGELAGRGMRWAEDHREIGTSVRSLYTLVLAFAVLGLSGLVNADGLLSVFVAGLAHNRVVTGSDRLAEVTVDETLNQFLVVPVFVVFGAVLPWQDWAALGWGGLLFVVVTLALRRLPVVLALRRPLRAGWPHVWWLGWFGPIGVAALFYLGHVHEQGVTDPAVWAAGTLVIAISTIVHGLTAGPARTMYRQRQLSGASTGSEA
jgi:NhaP-type Na+/H+ or K+/H+ antiporter